MHQYFVPQNLHHASIANYWLLIIKVLSCYYTSLAMKLLPIVIHLVA